MLFPVDPDLIKVGWIIPFPNRPYAWRSLFGFDPLNAKYKM
jgi:hypothetical protein